MATSCSPRCSLTTLRCKTNKKTSCKLFMGWSKFPFFSYVLCTTTCNQCNWMWWQAACIWFVLIVRASITKHVVLQLRETNKGSVAPPYAARTRTELSCVLLLRTSRYVNFSPCTQNIWEMKINKDSSLACAGGKSNNGDERKIFL